MLLTFINYLFHMMCWGSNAGLLFAFYVSQWGRKVFCQVLGVVIFKSFGA